MTIKVSIVEDDVRVRSNLARLIDRAEGFRCLSQHPNAENALEQLPYQLPEVVLMDINLPGMNGIECVRRLKELLPQTQIIMLTVYESTENIFNALSAGATGYLLKQTPPAELLAAIRDVHKGGSPMTSQIARKVVASFKQPAQVCAETEKLTVRELEILDHLTKGFSYKEIAEALKVSYDTVHAHIRNIYEKLHVRSRGQAVARRLQQTGMARPS